MTLFCNYFKTLKCCHFFQKVQSLQGLFFVELLDRETGVNEYIISHRSVRTYIHSGVSHHAADFDLGHVVLNLNNLSWNTQTH